MDAFKLKDVNGNAADPLKQTRSSSAEHLFEALSRGASGCTYDDVVVAAGNLLVNAVRQKCPTARDAQATYDELMARFKAILMDQHYFPNGQRRSVFAFHQIIQPSLLDARKGRKHN